MTFLRSQNNEPTRYSTCNWFWKGFHSIRWTTNFYFRFYRKWVLDQIFFNGLRLSIGTCQAVYSLNNGFTTDIFFGNLWVRQGDHFSSLLFILALETLVSQSRENRNIKGFFINGKEFKTTLFPDDMTCFLRDTHSYFRLLKSLKKILPDTQAFV